MGKCSLKFFLLLNLIVAFAFELQAGEKMRVLVLATGGTIAGVANPGDPQVYDPGQLTVDAILKEVPEINERFEVVGRQLRDPLAITPQNPYGYVNKPSSALLERHWLILAREANQALAADFDAVIVTHGTDTIEETGFFLQLTVNSPKPIFLVGAMRPAVGTIPPDGPDNMRTAFRLILDQRSQNKGTMIISAFKAIPAFNAMKVRTFPPNLKDKKDQIVPSDKLPSFLTAPQYGHFAQVRKSAGAFYQWKVSWRENNELLATKALKIKFDMANVSELPRVPVLYMQIGNDSAELLPNYYFLAPTKIKAYILVGSGNCSLTTAINLLIGSLWTDDGLLFARSAHVPVNWCRFNQTESQRNSTGLSNLTPQHAKILVQLLQVAIERNDDLGPLVAAQSGFRDKARAFFAENVPYPHQQGTFEPIHEPPPSPVKP